MTNTSKKDSQPPFNTNAMPDSEYAYVPTQFSTQDLKHENTNTPTQPSQNLDPVVNVTPASVTIESKKGKSSFKTFVVIGIIITAIIYGAVGFIYFQNQDLKRVIQNLNYKPEVTQSPQKEFNSSLVNIENGSVVYSDSGSKNVLVDKKAFPETGITGFTKVVVSPDKKWLCFESVPPATRPALYLSDTQGNNVKLISSNKTNCLWRTDSNYIFYQGKDTAKGNLNIYRYDLTTATEENLTKEVLSGISTNFSMVGLSSDESKLICSFKDPENDESFQCEIDLTSLVFSTL